MYQEAKFLIDQGLVILPAEGRSPRVEWTRYVDVPPQPMEYQRWFRSEKPMWMLTGSASRVIVLDCDNEAALEFWREQLGELLETTTRVATRKGYHYWFRLPEDVHGVKTWHVKQDGGVHFDLQADGAGVMVPPSPHPDGGHYDWEIGPESMAEAPAMLWDHKVRPRFGGSSGEGGDSSVRSLLADLLKNPPEEGGRNVWMAQVAGHLAANIRYQDAYQALLAWINDGIHTPLEEVELSKTMESVWRTEKNKIDPEQRERWSEKSGYLVAKDRRLYTMCRESDGDQTLFEAHPVTNFDIVTRGRIQAEDGSIRYRIDVEMEDKTIPLTFDAAKVTTPSELRRVFYPYGCTFTQPAGDIYRTTSLYDRIVSYVVGQETSLVREIPHLGWLPGTGYVTHDSILTATGETPVIEAGVAPATTLRQWAPYHYGTGDPKTALSILREVLTFHDEDVCAIFGSWWATLPLKAQITQMTALFPFMAVEAPSESGKTTGFFSLMIALNGSIEGHGEYTTAALRDRASAHRNGIVWIDDVSDTYSVFEIIRQATSEGSRSKKGLDRSSQETVQMVSPIVLTGEGLGALENEKALKDRAIQLRVGSPTGRKSRHDSSRSQWDDIVRLKNTYPQLADYAGDIVVEVLKREAMVSQLQGLRLGNGRHADKLAIVRLGSRLLADMLDDGEIVDRVDRWAELESSTYVRDENYLVLRVIPSYLDSTAIQHNGPIGGPPVYLENDRLWFSEVRLAAWWEERRGLNDREKALGSKSSLTQQRQKLGDLVSRRRSILGSRPRGTSDQQLTYYQLPEDISKSILERSGRSPEEQGVLRGGVQHDG